MGSRTSDPLDALLAHNLWATRRIIEACRGVSEEEFRRPFPIGPGDYGGLEALLSHIVGAMRRWADRIAGKEIRPPLEAWRREAWMNGESAEVRRTPDELLALLDEAHADLAGVVGRVRREGEAGLSRDVVLRFAGPQGPGEHVFSAGAAIASAIVHGHYHRAQCVNILRQLKVRCPSLDVIDWQQAEEGG